MAAVGDEGPREGELDGVETGWRARAREAAVKEAAETVVERLVW